MGKRGDHDERHWSEATLCDNRLEMAAIACAMAIILEGFIAISEAEFQVGYHSGTIDIDLPRFREAQKHLKTM